MAMLSGGSLQARLSAHPWSLYHSEHLTQNPSRKASGFYSHLLRDDLRKQRYAYKISFVPDGVDWSRASESMFALLNDFNDTGYARDPAALVCDFVDGLLEESSGGKALLLELHSLPNERNRAKVRRARRQEAPDTEGPLLPSLGLIPNWSVKATRSGLSQVAPVVNQRPIAIPGTRVHRLRLRRRNLDGWKRAVKELRQVDAARMIDAGVDRLSWEGYSFSEALAAQNLAVASSTADIGWDGRGTFAELVTSPYMAFRRLRFVRFWIEAVQDSVSFLNQFTASESLYGPEAFSFSLTGLPTATDLTQAMDDLRNGSITVEQTHNTYLFPRSTLSAGPALQT
jgi:hypothetical protein